jgi:hypothetical protein
MPAYILPSANQGSQSFHRLLFLRPQSDDSDTGNEQYFLVKYI